MSEHEPTLGDVMAAVTGLRGELTGLSENQDRLRVDLMARMDRLQNNMTEQADEHSVLLDLLATNQGIAERSQSEARASFDLHARMATAMTSLQRQLRRLEDEVRELRDGRSGP
jgi:hypothetical protein